MPAITVSDLYVDVFRPEIKAPTRDLTGDEFYGSIWQLTIKKGENAEKEDAVYREVSRITLIRGYLSGVSCIEIGI
jgi:hypothetical protein